MNRHEERGGILTFEAIVESQPAHGRPARRSRLRELPGSVSLIAPLLLGMSLLLASSAALAESEPLDAPLPEEGSVAAPPGTLGPEGMVPMARAGDGSVEPEQIGHVPGPDEGVYGDPPNSGIGHPEERGWAYDDGYFFALTRGLETDTDLGPGARRWVRPLTLTFDVVTLPTAALAGLSGRAPETQPESAPTSESSAEAPPSEPAS